MPMTVIVLLTQTADSSNHGEMVILNNTLQQAVRKGTIMPLIIVASSWISHIFSLKCSLNCDSKHLSAYFTGMPANLIERSKEIIFKTALCAKCVTHSNKLTFHMNIIIQTITLGQFFYR